MKKEEMLDLDFYPVRSKISEGTHDSLVDRIEEQPLKELQPSSNELKGLPP